MKWIKGKYHNIVKVKLRNIGRIKSESNTLLFSVQILKKKNIIVFFFVAWFEIS